MGTFTYIYLDLATFYLDRCQSPSEAGIGRMAARRGKTGQNGTAETPRRRAWSFLLAQLYVKERAPEIIRSE